MLKDVGDNETLRPCFVDILAQFDDATVAKIYEDEGTDEQTAAINAGYNACVENAPPTTRDVSAIDDPDLAALVADPVVWMQARWNGIVSAMCNNDPAGIIELVSASSTNLDAFTSHLGTCPIVTVTNVRTWTGGKRLDDYLLGGEIQLYVTDSGWAGDGHEWSAHFVREDGRWKLLNNG